MTMTGHIIPFFLLVLFIFLLIGKAWIAASIVGVIFTGYIIWLDWIIKKMENK